MVGAVYCSEEASQRKMEPRHLGESHDKKRRSWEMETVCITRWKFVGGVWLHVDDQRHDHRRERDPSCCQDKSYFLAFDYDTVLKSIAGQTTLMMDSGDDVLCTVPCFEDYAVPPIILCLDLAGRHFSCTW